MNQIILNIIASIIGILVGIVVGLGIVYLASKIFGLKFKPITQQQLIIILVTVITFSVLQNLLKSYGISHKTLSLLYLAIALFGLLYIMVFRHNTK